MTYRKFIEIVAISIFLFGCTGIKTSSYFHLRENQVESYNGFFVKDPSDSNYKRIEKIFGSISDKDSVYLRLQIVHKTMNIEGHKAFYSVDVEDTLRRNPSIG